MLPWKYEAAVHTCFQHYLFYFAFILFIFWAANQHIRMISEGSCDTEDWSNDAENFWSQDNKLHFKIYYNIQQLS